MNLAKPRTLRFSFPSSFSFPCLSFLLFLLFTSIYFFLYVCEYVSLSLIIFSFYRLQNMSNDSVGNVQLGETSRSGSFFFLPLLLHFWVQLPCLWQQIYVHRLLSGILYWNKKGSKCCIWNRRQRPIGRVPQPHSISANYLPQLLSSGRQETPVILKESHRVQTTAEPQSLRFNGYNNSSPPPQIVSNQT